MPLEKQKEGTSGARSKDEVDYVRDLLRRLDSETSEFTLSYVQKEEVWRVCVSWGGGNEVETVHVDRFMALGMLASALNTDGLQGPKYMGPDFNDEDDRREPGGSVEHQGDDDIPF